jgi:hypothetical protein
MKEVESLILQGNAAFNAGRTDLAMLHFLDAMKKSGALENVVKYAKKYHDNLFENQLMVQKLLSSKYNILIVPGALQLFLINVKNQMEKIEADIQYERFKTLMLAKHPRTVEQIIDVFIDEFETPSSKEKGFLSKVLMEHGLNYSIYDIDGFCNLRANAKELARFERSLDWRKPTTFTNIDVMTGYEFEDFIVDLFINSVMLLKNGNGLGSKAWICFSSSMVSVSWCKSNAIDDPWETEQFNKHSQHACIMRVSEPLW